MKNINEIGEEIINWIPFSPKQKEKRKKDIKIDYSGTFINVEYINCIMYMYSCGICIIDICNYVGLSDIEVNNIIDAYNDCLL